MPAAATCWAGAKRSAVSLSGTITGNLLGPHGGAADPPAAAVAAMVPLVSDRLPYSWLEDEQFKSGADVLAGPLYGVNEATEALARTMEPLRAPAARADPPPPDYWIMSAILHMAAIGIRSARAATILVRYGYAPRAFRSCAYCMKASPT